MDLAQLEHYRQLLETQRRETLELIESFKAQGIHENMNDAVGELSAYDQHPADYGSQMYEREKDLGFLENLKDQLHMVDLALERISNGTYGICQDCHKPIDPKRLEALPQAALCIQCKLNDEKRVGPDAGKQRLSFGHSFRNGSSFTGFDGEDAWQVVARFGTANTRQDLVGTRGLDGQNSTDEEMDILDAVEEYGEGD
ncbi:MAG TPA: TraR/DksA C4-type zinc finger protein [Limnochordia bacterium]|nr:TraR/DksA C4-type zinc finger protein [Limnochordia bacterium]